MSSTPPRLAVRIVGGIVIVLLVVAGLELSAAAYFAFRDGEFISVRNRLARTPNAFVNEINVDGCRYIDILYPHPYLAHVHRYDPEGRCAVAVNRSGLLGRDYPLRHDDTRFTILLAGGSVAAQVAGAQTRQGSPLYLEDALNRCFKPPRGERFVVLNGGAGGWKQPIMPILYLLYGEVFDGIVTLEGFNEHYTLQHTRLELPSNNFEATNAFLAGYERVAATWLANEMLRFARGNWLISRSFAAYAVFKATVNRLERVGTSQPSRDVGTLHSIFQLSSWTSEEKAAFNIHQYRKYMRSMLALAKPHGAYSAFFIQPAPAIGKVLTDEERRVVGPLDYGPLYRRMADALLELANEQIPVFSLLDVFAEERDTLYQDHIHMNTPPGNARGYRIMAAAMADRIGESWRLTRTCE
jgi:hypothetical protein